MGTLSMKISVILTDDKGQTFHGVAELALSTSGKAAKQKDVPKGSPGASVSFSVSIRAFIKEHARGLSGPERFAVLVAYLCKGQLGKEVANSDIETQWNRMKPLLGGKKLNPAHSTRAKEHGWIDSPSRGKYVICPGWKGALRG
jgi:hypothetical protein